MITASYGNVSVGRGDSSLQIYIVFGIYIYVGEYNKKNTEEGPFCIVTQQHILK
jgi:hypothetical protein